MFGCSHMSPPWTSNLPFDHARGCQVAADASQYPWADLRDALAVPNFVNLVRRSTVSRRKSEDTHVARYSIRW